MAQQERKGKHIKTSGFLLFLLRFVLRKQEHVQQLEQPEATMPADKCLFQLQGKMAFGKHLNYGALHHQRSTSLFAGNALYTPSSRVSAPTVGSLACPWQSQQLKCWFDAWHFNIATLPETWPTLAIVFQVSKRLLIIWPKSLFSMFSFSSSKENSWSE